MSVISFERLPDSARLWIFGCQYPLDQNQSAKLTENMKIFLEQWTAHKSELLPAWELRYGQFILVGLDESMIAASGCSIDSMVHNLRDFEAVLGANIVNTNSMVFYRGEDEAIYCVDRPEFKDSMTKGSVSENTIVFDNTIQTVGELKQGRWEVPMKESWHGRAFKVKVESVS